MLYPLPGVEFRLVTYEPPSYPPPPGGYGYQPQPGFGYPPPMGGYPTQQGTNGMAIASLVCSVIGPFVCGVATVLGLVFGFIGLHQIRTSGQQGRGMAIAGIIISALTVVAGVIIVIALVLLAQADSRRHRYHHRDYYDYSTAIAATISRTPQTVSC